MKGFMHVVEVILVVLLVFFVFTQFSSVRIPSTEWSEVKLRIMGSDILSSLDIQGVDWFNESELREKFDRLLPSNVIHNLRLENVIKPRIRIGCLCDDGEFSQLVSILSPGWFVVNEENITFEVVKVENLSEIFNLDFDVSLFFDCMDLEPYETPLRNFLKHDKGVVEICDLKRNDTIQKNYFGLRFSPLSPNSNTIPFSGQSRIVGSEIYTIRKYFYHIPIFYDSFENLNQWNTKTGNPAVVEFGDGKSVNLQAGTENTWIYSDYNDFSSGEINLDVYMESGIFYLEFGLDPATDEAYVAAFSTDPSFGFDSFYRQSGGPVLTPIGTNASHITTPGEWHHMKVVVEGGNFKLYNDGKLVATASELPRTGAIGLRNEGGDAYVDNVRITFEKGHRFQNFLDPSENVTQVDDEEEKILLAQDSGVSACVINYGVQGGKGRTVWLSAGETTPDEQKILIKSLIAWAAGDTYDLLKGEVKEPVVVYLYKTFNKDMLQEVKIVLSLGYLY